MIRILFFILPILAIFISIFVILFTPFGSNKFIKPLVNSYLQKKIKEPKIEITRLDSKYGWISIDAKSDNGIKAHTEGDVSYLSKKFGLNYKVNAKSVKLDNRDIKVDLNIAGQAVGSIKNLGVNGRGEAFGSNLDYKFIVKDKKPQAINANISSAEIAKILALIHKPPFIDGLLSINANMPNLDIKNPKGRADVNIVQGRFNRGLISKEFGIKIPKDEQFRANFKAGVKGKYIVGLGDLNTTTAKLKIKKLTSTLDFNQAKGYYSLKINNLSRLNELAKIDLKGPLALDGVFYANLAKNIYQVSASTKSLNGLLKATYTGNKAKVVFKDVSVVKILKMLSQPFYVTSGSINGVVNVANIKHLNGAFDIATNGVLNKKLLKVKLPSYKYKVRAKGVLKSGKLSVRRANIITSFVNLTLQDLQYNLLTNAAKGLFSANIGNLRALELFTKMALNGKLKVSGEFEYANRSVKLKAKTSSLGGSLYINYNGNRLDAKFQNISLVKVLYMLNQPHYLLKATASGNLKIVDINRLDGAFNLQSLGAVDTKTVKKLHNIDLGKVFKYSLLIKKGIIKKGIILTKPKVNTSYGAIVFDYLNYDTKKSYLSGKYKLQIDNLARLEPLIGQRLNGSFALSGTIKQSPNQLLISAVANELGGVIHFMLDSPKLNVEAAGLNVVSILRMLNYEQVLDGVAKINLKYNTKNKQGDFAITLDEARFLNSKLVATLKQYANFDLSKEIFSKAIINGNINKNIVTFNLNTESQRVKISTQDAKIDTKNQTINARVKIVHKNQDYNFRLSGPIKDPHIKVIFTGYIKNKVKKKVLKELKKQGLDKEIKKIIPKELNILKENNETKEQLKKIIPKEVKGLFDKLL